MVYNFDSNITQCCTIRLLGIIRFTNYTIKIYKAIRKLIIYISKYLKSFVSIILSVCTYNFIECSKLKQVQFDYFSCEISQNNLANYCLCTYEYVFLVVIESLSSKWQLIIYTASNMPFLQEVLAIWFLQKVTIFLRKTILFQPCLIFWEQCERLHSIGYK